jgi:hypothetical protein
LARQDRAPGNCVRGLDWCDVWALCVLGAVQVCNIVVVLFKYSQKVDQLV